MSKYITEWSLLQGRKRRTSSTRTTTIERERGERERKRKKERERDSKRMTIIAENRTGLGEGVRIKK